MIGNNRWRKMVPDLPTVEHLKVSSRFSLLMEREKKE